MKTDPWPYLRLWQSVALQAIYDATHPNHRRIEARMFIAGDAFTCLCQLLGWNETQIRNGLDEEGLWDRFRKLRRNGGFR